MASAQYGLYSQKQFNTLLASEVSPAFVVTANAARRMNSYLLRLLRLLARTTMVVQRYIVFGPLGPQELSEVKFDGLVRVLMNIMIPEMVQYTVQDAGRVLEIWESGSPRGNGDLVLSLTPSRILIGNHKKLAVVLTAIIEYVALEMLDTASTIAMNKYGTGKINQAILDEAVTVERGLHYLYYNLGFFKKHKNGRISRKRVARARPDTEDFLLIDALLKRPGPPQALLTQAVEQEKERVRKAEKEELAKLKKRGRSRSRAPTAKLPVRGLSPLLAAIKQERKRVKQAQEQQVEEVYGTPRRNRRVTKKKKSVDKVNKLIDNLLKGEEGSKSKGGVNPLLVRASKPMPGIGPKCKNVMCVHGKVCNYKTGRCVDKKGTIGKEIMKMYQQ